MHERMKSNLEVKPKQQFQYITTPVVKSYPVQDD